MIQLRFVEKPTQLTDKLVKELTKEFNKTGKDVWKRKYITEALLKMSLDKCCFCETKLGEESKYMEVEHFHPKSIYPNEVVEWENLLPICKRCNGKKSDHDTKQEEIIHPVKNNPKEHLKLENYRLKGLTELGKRTIGVVNLNDRERLVTIRFKIGDKLIMQLELLLKSTKNYFNSPSIENKNDLIESLTNLMLEGTKKYEYSATAATIILNDDNYQEIKRLFISHDLWNDDFIELEKQVKFCALI
jgi:uncharacterized protein (TIGR02646 family)